MQNVTFVNSQNQVIATASTDVPRSGEEVVIANQRSAVAAVRYFVYPGGVVHAVVLLVPAASDAAITAHFQNIKDVASHQGDK